MFFKMHSATFISTGLYLPSIDYTALRIVTLNYFTIFYTTLQYFSLFHTTLHYPTLFKCCGLPSPSRCNLLRSMLKTAIGPVTADEIQLCCSRYTTIFHAYFCILFCNTKVVCCSKEWAIPWVIVMFGPTLCVSPRTPGSRCIPHRAVQAQTHRGRAYPPFPFPFRNKMKKW